MDKAAGVFGSENEVEGSTFVAAHQSIVGDLRNAVEALMPHLQGSDQQAASSAMAEIETSPDDPGRTRRALGTLAGIARSAGEIGVPVVEAVKSIMQVI